MSWVTVLWSMIVSACLTLGLVHGLIWMLRRDARASLVFALTAVGTAALAADELWMMRAGTPAEFARAVLLLHVPAWALIIALVSFMRIYLRAGRRWLAWTVFGVRTLSLILNFLTGVNLNYREVTAVNRIPFLGELVSTGAGVANPWMLLGQFSLLLFVIFVSDAAIMVWRRGDRQRALLVGGSIVFFAFMGSAQAVGVFWGILPMPITASLFYMGILLAMGYELSRDLLRVGKLERELRESEQRLDLAADAANLGVWLLDIEGNEMRATDHWRMLFGFAKFERLDLEKYWDRLHPEDREAVREARARAIQGGGRYETEYRVVLPDGMIRWISSRGRVEFNEAGKPLLVRGVSFDVTARREAEKELHERRGEFAHLSRVTMLGELSGSLAHELNQPLTAILSNAQAAEHYLAQETPDLSQLREILADIVAEDERAGQVIRRLRLLLKKGEIQLQPVDANATVAEVLKLARSDLTNRGVTVETELAPGLPPVHGDSVQLQQVLLNLVMNACDAVAGNDSKGRLLTVRTLLAGETGVRIEVSDVGRGLPAGGAEKAFERYFTTKPHGLGLGLSVCRTIITAHGGTLGAENNIERGATFHCILPLAKEPSL
jgi:two-component system sensor kinase FixL